MAAGTLDKVKGGALIGLIAGLLIYYAGTFTGSFLSFWVSWMTSIAEYLIAQSWMSWASFAFNYMGYIISALIGIIVGAYADYKW